MNIRHYIISASAAVAFLSAPAADRLMLLGDMHLDRIGNHDMEWLATKGDNLRQVTREYTVWTRDNFPSFAKTVCDAAQHCSAVIQLGDLSEGLAGNQAKAHEMANDTFLTIDSLGLNIPFIMTKGNHDITGPGAKEAFRNVYLPAMSRLSQQNDTLKSATYSKTIGSDIQIVCYDPWDNKSTPALLDSLFRSSPARHKFIAIHEPVIPVNYRCWHVYRKDDKLRSQLLETIARNKAIVLCAHLHKYSVVKRRTPYGPIIQIMVNSVISKPTRDSDPTITADYGLSIFDGYESWDPASEAQRRQWIEEETQHVDFYRYADINGYATLDIDNDSLILRYFYGSETAPVETVNISNLYQ